MVVIIVKKEEELVANMAYFPKNKTFDDDLLLNNALISVLNDTTYIRTQCRVSKKYSQNN